MTTMMMTFRRVLRHSHRLAPAAAPGRSRSRSLGLGLSMSLSLGLGLLLAGCGGGGGGNSAAAGVAAAVTVGISATPTTATVGQTITLNWTSSNAASGSCSASGAWSGALATSGSQAVTAAAAGTANYTITCSGVASTASVTVNAAPVLTASGPNTAAIVFDSGPDNIGNALDVPYVSVTVCRPGTTVCQTIDHVLLDTGSTGLRLIAPLSASLALPAVAAPSGAAAGECVKFADGYTWGSVQRADVQIGGETASSIAIQVIGDPASNFAHVPADCTNAGGNIGTVAKLGARGVLGVGLFKQDCGSGCVNNSGGAYYYACAAGSCSASTMALAQQVGNPVASFATDNNGVLVLLPAVPAAGTTSLSGTLVFGVNTQSNNTLGGATIYRTDNSGNFSTTYQGRTLSASFLDTGSNGLFFDDSSLPACSQDSDFYCPTSPTSLSAVNTAADGSASGTVNFVIVNEQNRDNATVALSVGGTAGTSLRGAFDWGVPFFFGRRVFVVLENDSVAGAVGPYWAY